MSTYDRLSEVYKSAEEFPIDGSSKIVLIGDCHKGNGTWADDFSRNQNIFYAALKYYDKNNFTYIDMGDSEELWKNKSFSQVSDTYPDVFRMLHRFYEDKRFYMLFGNHDDVKSEPHFAEFHLQNFYDYRDDASEPLFPGIRVHEGLILRHTENNVKLFLVHGHQGDLMADILWRLARFLTRHIWRRLESLGLKDPTSAAMNFALKKKVERKIMDWIDEKKQPVICGHTHRPSCPTQDGCPYFNVGCCIYTASMTCLEIINSEITLIKWSIKTNDQLVFYVDREVIAQPWKITG